MIHEKGRLAWLDRRQNKKLRASARTARMVRLSALTVRYIGRDLIGALLVE
jgi:hypothetical protein